jgi:hypothetical protein
MAARPDELRIACPEITRWDPRGDGFVDVWRSSKNKVVVDGAPDRLLFKVIAELSNDWALTVYLDTHGSPRADYRLRHSETFGRGGCNVRRLPDGERRDVPCDRTFIDDVLLAKLWWSVPRPFLAPDKVVRWRVHTHDVGSILGVDTTTVHPTGAGIRRVLAGRTAPTSRSRSRVEP